MKDFDLKKSLLVFIPGISLLFFSYGNYWSSHWYAKWALIVAVFSVFYSWYISLRSSLLFFPILCLSLLSGVYIGIWNDNIYLKTSDALMFQSISKGAFYSYLTLVMASFLVVHLPKTLDKYVENYLGFISISSILYTIFEMAKGMTSYTAGAFSGNSSMNACLIACTMPFALKSIPNPLARMLILIATGVACILSHSSIGIGTYIVVCLLLEMRTRGASFKEVFIRLSALSFPLLWALRCVPVTWLSSSGRMTVWKSIMSWWYAHSNIWFGAGIGTGISLFPSIQKMYGTSATGYYLWMHSEPLQILFELGIFGAVSALIAFAYLCFKSWKSPHLFASLIGFGSCSIADYPLRLPIHCTAVTLLAWLIIKKEKVEL